MCQKHPDMKEATSTEYLSLSSPLMAGYLEETFYALTIEIGKAHKALYINDLFHVDHARISSIFVLVIEIPLSDILYPKNSTSH